MIKESQLKQLIKHLVKEVLNELDTTGSDSADLANIGMIDGMDSINGNAGLSPVEQQRLARKKKEAARKNLKISQSQLKKVDNDIKSLKSTYDLTRRLTKPQLKADIDAQKRSLSQQKISSI